VSVLKLFRLSIFASLFLISYSGYSQSSKNDFTIIPAPVSIVKQSGIYTINDSTGISLDIGVKPEDLILFNRYLQELAGVTLISKSTKDSETSIQLKLDSFLVSRKEGYHLLINKKGITISGHDNAGVFYGVQTLLQLMKKSKDGVISVPYCSIDDYPRFSYRGMHLDVSRHMFPVSSIKKWIDILALYKINTFHWHLTDDQGWRIEIKKYPELQTISSMRKETIIGHKRRDPHLFDGKPYGGFYTQEEVAEIIKYASERQIEIIPEIELPGHAQAALAAYPMLGCTGGPYQAATYWGIFDDVYCAGKEETFKFLENVLDEVATLFPSPYIHIGGDECPKTQWKVCPDCQKRIKDEKLKNEQELQSYFVRRIEKYLQRKNKKIIGWDEILEGGLAPSATVMSWRGLEGGIAAAKMHHDVIMTPEKYVYLDYYQSLYDGEPIAAGGYTPLAKVYGYEPVPEELNAKEARYIKGVQANVWSEYLESPEKAEYQMFPRMIALAEIAWTKKASRNYPDFLGRLRAQDGLLNWLQVNRFKNFDEINAQVLVKGRKPQLTLKSSLPNAAIHYTLDGKTPDKTSLVYKKPLIIAKSSTIKAAIFRNGTMQKRLFNQRFMVNKSTGKDLTLKNQPSGNFIPADSMALLNGVEGSLLYNDDAWTGFSGEDLEAVIDLGSQVMISTVGMNILKYHWQKMWEPDHVRFEVSSDGINYKEVYRQTAFAEEGINKVSGKIAPVAARYVKVSAINKGTIPEGAYGAGGKAWLMVDEIYVN
jgi:hexosaminidase